MKINFEIISTGRDGRRLCVQSGEEVIFLLLAAG